VTWSDSSALWRCLSSQPCQRVSASPRKHRAACAPQDDRPLSGPCPAPVEPGISAGLDLPVVTLGVFHTMSQKRKRLSGTEKIAIVKRYLVDRVPISDLCDQHGIQPSQIYRWQAAVFEHGADAFDLKRGRNGRSAESAKDVRIAKLEAALAQKDAKLAQKNEMISELMEENVLAKKSPKDGRSPHTAPPRLPFGIGTNATNLCGRRPQLPSARCRDSSLTQGLSDSSPL
jgi:transposase